MEYRRLGKSGLTVSAVGLGCNNFGAANDEAATKVVVHKALDLGVTLFDTAEFYNKGKSEEFLGKALGPRRKDVIVATKFGLIMDAAFNMSGIASRNYILRAVETSLRNLGTDYIDLYQVHFPDATTPMEETLSTLDALVRKGMVRYIGHSNFTGSMTADAAWAAKSNSFTPFISAQNRYSMLTRSIERDLVRACEIHGVGVLPYFPLESGLLSGKYKRGVKAGDDTRFGRWGAGMTSGFASDEKFAQVEKLQDLAAASGCSILDVAFGWLLSRPYIGSVIAGATRPEQVEQNIKAAGWRPSEEQAKEIDAITPPPAPHS